MKLIVNGIEQDIASPPLTPLLHVLREELDITSPKAGCQQGGCGTCTVLVDGEPRRSCLTALAAVDGAEITTLEGLGGVIGAAVMVTDELFAPQRLRHWLDAGTPVGRPSPVGPT